MQETFDSLAVLDDPVSEKKQVMFILASLLESFQTMVTALAASTADVPSLTDVKEKLRCKELRQKQAGPLPEDGQGKALTAGYGQKRSFAKSKLTCHFCGKPGHFKRDCRKWAAEKRKRSEQSQQNTGGQRQSASTAEVPVDDTELMMITTHALSSVSRGNWIVDSGATCHV